MAYIRAPMRRFTEDRARPAAALPWLLSLCVLAATSGLGGCDRQQPAPRPDAAKAVSKANPAAANPAAANPAAANPAAANPASPTVELAPEDRAPTLAEATTPTGWEQLVLEAMTTRVEVIAPAGRRAEEAGQIVLDVFRDVESRMNEWKAGSALSDINVAAGGAAVTAPADLRDLIRRGQEIGRRTHGAFDVSWAALWGLWDFRAEPPRLPDAGEMHRRVALVDYRKVELDDDAGTVRLPLAGMKLGLGGIAKGYALDLAARRLRAAGIRNFLLSAGGQVMAGGDKQGRAWRVGIRDPRGAIDDFFGLLEVRDLSVSTSGDYERFFVIDGLRYHHIIDPRTGAPARGLRCATVMTADGTLADALSTAVMVLGRERGLAVIETWQGVEAIVVDDQGKVHATSGARDRLIMRHPPAP